jgi:hypothetical protein
MNFLIIYIIKQFFSPFAYLEEIYRRKQFDPLTKNHAFTVQTQNLCLELLCHSATCLLNILYIDQVTSVVLGAPHTTAMGIT